MFSHMSRLLVCLVLGVSLCACSMAPDYEQPKMDIPDSP